jgi:serine protease Do
MVTWKQRLVNAQSYQRGTQQFRRSGLFVPCFHSQNFAEFLPKFDTFASPLTVANREGSPHLLGVLVSGASTMETKRTSTSLRMTLAALAVATSFAGGYAYSQRSATSNSAPIAITSTAQAAVPTSRDGVAADFADLAAQQGPAVVNISVSGKVKTRFSGMSRGLPDRDPNDPFAELFRRFQAPQPNETPTHALGSGFVVDSNGLVLTNAHVVANADEVTVRLTDSREFKAKVVGSDKLSDVAVLKIDAKNLPTVRIGDPQRARVGEWVVAIGSPFGLENTVTAGIVSAKARTLPDEGYVPFLQTDVPINPGNSGGPLFNMAGEVIGINSQIYSRSGGYQGLSFAIPIDVAMKVERQLVDHGKVSRGRLGIGIEPVTAELAQTLGLDKPKGALVGSVQRRSPADKGGLTPGDVVLQFNGKTIERANELPPLVSDLTPGTNVTLQVWRQGKTKDVSVVLGELKATRNDAAADAESN